MFRLMNFDNLHTSMKTPLKRYRHFYHSRFCLLVFSIHTSTHHCHDCCFDFYHHSLVLFFLELNINAVCYILLSLASSILYEGFEVYPCGGMCHLFVSFLLLSKIPWYEHAMICLSLSAVPIWMFTVWRCYE